MNLQDAANQVLDHAATKHGEEKAALISYANLLLRNEIVPRKISKAAGMVGINFDGQCGLWRSRYTLNGKRYFAGRFISLQNTRITW